jgi:chemotaxis protein CheZ
MPVQRKIFRVEETLLADGEAHDALAADQAGCPPEIIDELRALRSLIQQHLQGGQRPAPNDNASREMRKLKIELDVIGDAIKQTRSEIVSLQDQGFDASRVVRIDQLAQTLIASLKAGHEQQLAQDIQDRVTAIFEACNFHDLTGQRLSKVAGTVKMVEEHLARMMEIWSVIDRFNVEAAQSAAGHLDGLINGPKLDGDEGHSSQDDIDKLFH